MGLGSNVVNFGADNGNGANSKIITWNQDIAADDNAFVLFGAINTQATITLAATVGATSMNPVSPIFTALTASPNRLYLYALTLLSPPTGLGTAIATALTGGSAVFYNMAGAFSLKGVTGFGTPVTAIGTGSTASITAAAPTNGRLLLAWTAGGGTTGATFTSPTGPWTDRFDAGFTQYTANNRPLTLGDAVGAGWNVPLTFGATVPTTAAGWGAMAIPVF